MKININLSKYAIKTLRNIIEHNEAHCRYDLENCGLNRSDRKELAILWPGFLLNFQKINLENLTKDQLYNIDWEELIKLYSIDFEGDSFPEIIFSIEFLEKEIEFFKKFPELGWSCILTDEIADILLNNNINPITIPVWFSNLKTTQHLVLNAWNKDWPLRFIDDAATLTKASQQIYKEYYLCTI
jgi:hypothetical protein